MAIPRTLRAAAMSAAGLALVASPARGHALVGGYHSSLPLWVYVSGAAIAVALSFVVALRAEGRWRPGPATPLRQVPRGPRIALRIIGLVAWAWIVVQFLLGGMSDADVASLFGWTFGWVGLAMVCALVGPIWTWLDPFATLHDLGAGLGRRLGIAPRTPAAYPEWLERWPAVAFFGFVVWLELADGAKSLGGVVVGYTIITSVMMARYGSEVWRRNGEVFSVWFATVGRTARWVVAQRHGPATVRRQSFPDGLLGRSWSPAEVTLVAFATGAILYDGLSQTEPFVQLFGVPSRATATLALATVLALVSVGAHLVAGRMGRTGVGAGLLPIAVGYLIAHYLTFLLMDGQRLLVAIADPFQLGWDLTGTAFHRPTIEGLPTSVVWAVMFGAVVGGHVLGAWAGHLRSDGVRCTGDRQAQLPLAVVMVLLTTITLWSLGQAVFVPPDERVPGAELAAPALVDLSR